VKEIERLKEQSKRNNWRMANKGNVGGMSSNNPALLKVGEGVLGRLNLGGAGAGLANRPADGGLSASQSNFSISKGDGGIGTYRSNLGVDKSMDNFKLGFGNKFGSALGGGLGGGGGGAVGGAVGTSNMKLGLGGAKPGDADTSIRKSNLLSTPSSKGGKFDNDVDEFENN